MSASTWLAGDSVEAIRAQLDPLFASSGWSVSFSDNEPVQWSRRSRRSRFKRETRCAERQNSQGGAACRVIKKGLARLERTVPQLVATTRVGLLLIVDRFFGTPAAYMHEPYAARYEFTSALSAHC